MRIASPILYTFRRCPYAMRARMALYQSGVECEHREVKLADKPASMLRASPKGTVPVLVLHNGEVIEESLDIMYWALERSDQEKWLRPQTGRSDAMAGLIADNDGSFKADLDRYKYPNRYEDVDPLQHRDRGLGFLVRLDSRIREAGHLFGDRTSLADIAIFPFVRQFAHTDIDWFNDLPLPALQTWLAQYLNSELFRAIMAKRPVWVDADGTSESSRPA